MASKRRKAVPKRIETEVLLHTRRRCPICFGLKGDLGEKQGQIAHLDRDSSNNSADNLAYLCLTHHDEFDSRRSQSKGITIEEVKRYRNDLIKTLSDWPAQLESEGRKTSSGEVFWTDPVWRKVITSVKVAIGVSLLFMLLNPRNCAKPPPPPPPLPLRIVSPEAGALVEQGAAVSFTSPFVDLDHYITVIPLGSPDRYVVDGPLHISTEPSTSGRAIFGNEAAGIGERFAMQIIATKGKLAEGVLAHVPSDAKLSPQVVVYRAR
jgi:hypothetical protein